ncbi:hypothetical protein LEP1GSC202_1822 [Leptospira yanagawae serovar Saopaulo str. Sao Paulo = ATCC 700523]|uniref:Uncharacterized protein n=1 Tax=Leptospira yanagawae serovar Saopaulo str. Sao Paulo = ATCC 700523 TaxID=1249483 RepID=A0A5E8HEC4_9LEPT|nr:hypothetical protein [Leptospira yanagawae]EOQ88840.1 hypothetical protein LEP1GSC202_1822 [Leptospira yanagawae serovar Saopaulo str. Sao Paulo = ATCC 700523]
MILGQILKPYSLDQIRILEEKLNTYEIWVFVLVLSVAILLLVVVMQRLAIAKFRNSELFKSKQSLKLNQKDIQLENEDETNIIDTNTITQTPIHHPLTVTGKDLPEPGTIFKFSVPSQSNRLVLIGKREGNIVTRSSEILDHHLTIDIEPVDSENIEILSYQVEFRREGKVLIQYPTDKDFHEMEMKESFTISNSLHYENEKTFDVIQLTRPIRIKVGGKLGLDGKFKNGYFEFHLFTKDILEKTNLGNKRIEKQFYLKLYKIFPGYDTARQTRDGIVPMLTRFGGKL